MGCTSSCAALISVPFIIGAIVGCLGFVLWKLEKLDSIVTWFQEFRFYKLVKNLCNFLLGIVVFVQMINYWTSSDSSINLTANLPNGFMGLKDFA